MIPGVIIIAVACYFAYWEATKGQEIRRAVSEGVEDGAGSDGERRLRNVRILGVVVWIVIVLMFALGLFFIFGF